MALIEFAQRLHHTTFVLVAGTRTALQKWNQELGVQGVVRQEWNMIAERQRRCPLTIIARSFEATPQETLPAFLMPYVYGMFNHGSFQEYRQNVLQLIRLLYSRIPTTRDHNADHFHAVVEAFNGLQLNIPNPVPNYLLPTGMIVSFSGTVPPNGWLICDGRQISSRDYPRLYDVIELQYVPANENGRVLRHNANRHNHDNRLFYVPDLRGRVIVGVDGNTGRVTFNNTLAAIGGEERHVLTIQEIPDHSHTVVHNALAGDNGTAPFDRHYGGHLYNGGVRGNHIAELNPQITQPHNNMQPYLVLNYVNNG